MFWKLIATYRTPHKFILTNFSNCAFIATPCFMLFYIYYFKGHDSTGKSVADKHICDRIIWAVLFTQGRTPRRQSFRLRTQADRGQLKASLRGTGFLFLPADEFRLNTSIVFLLENMLFLVFLNYRALPNSFESVKNHILLWWTAPLETSVFGYKTNYSRQFTILSSAVYQLFLWLCVKGYSRRHTSFTLIKGSFPLIAKTKKLFCKYL